MPGPDIVSGFSLQELLPACKCLVAAVRTSKTDLPRWNVPSGHRGVFYKYWEPSKPLRQSMHRQHIHREIAELVDDRAPEAPPAGGVLSPAQVAQGRASWERAMASHHALCRCWEAVAGADGLVVASEGSEQWAAALPAALEAWQQPDAGAWGGLEAEDVYAVVDAIPVASL